MGVRGDVTRRQALGGLAAVAMSMPAALLGCASRGDGDVVPSDIGGSFLSEADETPQSSFRTDVTAGGDAQPQLGFSIVQDKVPDVMVDVRYHTTYNFVGERIDGYDEPLVILTDEATEAIRAASDDARARGLRLRIYDGYRPQRAVDRFVRWAEEDDGEEMRPYFYPDISRQDAFSLGYVARRSGHSRGSAVDLTLFDMAAGRELDMGGTFDFFGRLSHPDERSLVSDEQYANRMLLREVMVSAGFAPVSTEWWHFVLADEPYPDTYFDFPVARSSVT